MRLYEIKKKKQEPYDPIENARSSLEWTKERGSKSRPNGTKQLFVPREVERYDTRKEREDHILRDRAKFGYDDEGNMIQQYRDWIDQTNESLIREGVPMITGGNPLPGKDKPIGALFWTSTAKQLSNGKWTSAWNEFIQGGNTPGKASKIGYLYEVLPNTIVYELDNSNDALYIYKIFAELGRPNTARTDSKEWEKEKEIFGDILSSNEIEMNLVKKDFPWDQIAKHFDCIHHWGRSFGFDFRDFTASYDVESTVWFKSNQLRLLGQVPLSTNDNDSDDEY